MIGPVEFVKGYAVLPFHVGRQGDKFLVTNDLGGWALLTPEEFGLFKRRELDSEPRLFASLRSAGLIVTEDDMPGVKAWMRDRFWYLDNGASLHVVAVTDNCNLGCKYCYARTDSGEVMSDETALDVADFISRSPAETLIVEFSGGEPTTNFSAIRTVVDRTKELVAERNKQVGFAIVNNGTQWTEEKANYVTENRVGLCFSLDGPEDLHNLHRPYRAGGGTYGDVVKWIKYFRRIGHDNIRAIPVITRHSLERGRDIVDEYLSHGFRMVRFKYLAYFGRASTAWDELGYEPEEFLEAWKDVMEYIFQLNKRGIRVVENIAQIMAKKLMTITDPGFCELQMPCGAGISQLAYSPDGSVYTCDEGRMFEEFKMGNVHQTYEEVLSSDVLKSMILESSGWTDMCSSCELKPFCGVCPLESYHIRGRIDSRAVFDRRHKVHEGMLRYLIKRLSEEPPFRRMLRNWLRERRKSFYNSLTKQWG